ncbi:MULTISPECIES: transglutaminase-like domain-containing protein [Caballeronia]|uniref:transglutaminase-like domain-containing protein n=1 Tax=Caballeronia TaxID=1827195 RepID=UPI001F314FF3|nr:MULTISPECIES: transglutaminase family protein [Caballeronia]MDR5770132.1 transglutaminase family protein [Caballeronia sp. LZ028]
MTLEIKNSFTYVRRVEKGVNQPAETLRLGSGSCRNFAVLMMDAVRSLGLAARFVSGYIFVAEPRHDPGRRCDARMVADLSSRCRLGRFRSDQQHRRKPASDLCGRSMEFGSGAAAVGNMARRDAFVPESRRRRERN